MQSIIELGLMLSGAIGSALYIALSPCLFPLLPLFLLNNLQSVNSRKRSAVVTGALVIGMLISIGIFAAIAFFVTSVASFILINFTNLQAVLGALIIFFGIAMMSETLHEKLHLFHADSENQAVQPSDLKQVFFIGLGYTLMAAPCAGPSILAIISLFGVQSNIFVLVLMFFIVSIVIAIPYFAIALVTGEARVRMTRTLSANTRRIEIITGVILLVIGTILVLPILGIRLYI
jgi:thiol:disulfide interchange protein DsbD